jgi:hypothetical protein
MTENNLIPLFDEVLDFVELEPTQEEDVKTEDTGEDTPITEEIILEKENEVYAEGSDPAAISLYQEMKERGYVDPNDKFDGTWESFDEYFTTLPQKVLDSVIQELPDFSKNLVKFVATAGENITSEELINFVDKHLKAHSEDTNLDSLDSARSYLENVYKQSGLRASAIQSQLDDLEDSEELIQEAKKHYSENNSKKETEALIAEKENTNAEIKARQKAYAAELQKELVATGWKQEKIVEIQNTLSGSNFSNAIREITTSPKALVQLANFIKLYDPKQKNFNLDSFVKQVESKQTISLKEKLEKNQFGTGATNTKQNSKANPNEVEKLEPIFD